MKQKMDEPTLTDEERAAGWRITRLGKGPWQKIPPGTKLASDYLREHRARANAVRALIRLREATDETFAR